MLYGFGAVRFWCYTVLVNYFVTRSWDLLRSIRPSEFHFSKNFFRTISDWRCFQDYRIVDWVITEYNSVYSDECWLIIRARFLRKICCRSDWYVSRGLWDFSVVRSVWSLITLLWSCAGRGCGGLEGNGQRSLGVWKAEVFTYYSELCHSLQGVIYYINMTE